MQFSSTESAILKTVVYFDIFDFPLTLSELWRNLPSTMERAPAPSLLQEMIENGALNEKIEHKDGFYFLRGREDTLRIRSEHYRDSLVKIKKAKQIANILKYVPFIRSIIVCNTLGYFNARPESDIDFLILVEPGCLWTVRGLAIFLTDVFASRPAISKTKDAICLSFFASRGRNLKDLRLPDGDPYFDWWAANLLPIYDEDSSFEKFLAVNSWIKEVRPNSYPALLPARFRNMAPSKIIKDILQLLFSLPSRYSAEKFFEHFQRWCLPEKIRSIANNGTAVMLASDVLKFHLDDKREYFREELAKRVDKV